MVTYTKGAGSPFFFLTRASTMPVIILFPLNIAFAEHGGCAWVAVIIQRWGPAALSSWSRASIALLRVCRLMPGQCHFVPGSLALGEPTAVPSGLPGLHQARSLPSDAVLQQPGGMVPGLHQRVKESSDLKGGKMWRRAVWEEGEAGIWRKHPYGTEKLKRPHGNKGPKRQAHAGKGMKQKQPLLAFSEREQEDGSPGQVRATFLPGDALLSSKAARAEPAAHPLTAYTLLHVGGEIPPLILKPPGAK